MEKRLAIIIPAYKATFLNAALDSIAAQTCQDFTVYVGDDCSPEPIGSIVERYRDKTALVYHRFDSNLGGKDLVAQWERCIAISQGEPWIWLFSDDDVMEPNCVEQLLKQIDATKGGYDLYHFDINEIDEKGRTTKLLPVYPQVLGAYDYYKGKTSGRLRSYVVENVFSRTVYKQKGGFKNFDLAWGSDVATWCIFCGEKGMDKIEGAKVHWRRSRENITPNISRLVAERKMMANCELLAWAYQYFRNQKKIWEYNHKIFIRVIRRYRKIVGHESVKRAFDMFFKTHGHKKQWPRIYFMIMLPAVIYKFINKL